MLVVISPAKALDMDPVALAPTQPEFQADAVALAKVARALTLDELKKLMKLSDKLAQLNHDRFNDFAKVPADDAVKPAVLAFNGDTYHGLEAKTLSEDDIMWAQDHLRILSGLYGVLRPLDAMQPYRLEMGSRLKTARGKSLYDYWGATIAKALNAQADGVGAQVLVNCASQEYFGAVDLKALNLRVITPQFMEIKEDKPRIVSFFAKRARGAMARFIVENHLTDPEAIKGFTSGGYAFDPDLSAGDSWVFTRDYPT